MRTEAKHDVILILREQVWHDMVYLLFNLYLVVPFVLQYAYFWGLFHSHQKAPKKRNAGGTCQIFQYSA